MQVSTISIRNPYDTGWEATLINDSTPLSCTHSGSQLLTSDEKKISARSVDRLHSVLVTITCTGSGRVAHMTCHVKYRYKPIKL